MNTGRWKEIVEIVAVFSIVASLIFVGLQVKQEQEIAAATSVTMAAEGNRYWAELILENTEVWLKGLAGDPLSDIEAAQFMSLAEAYQIERFARWFRATRIGHASAEQFAIGFAMDLRLHPGLLTYWREIRQRNQDVAQLTGQPDANFGPLVDRNLEQLEKSDSVH